MTEEELDSIEFPECTHLAIVGVVVRPTNFKDHYVVCMRQERYGTDIPIVCFLTRHQDHFSQTYRYLTDRLEVRKKVLGR